MNEWYLHCAKQCKNYPPSISHKMQESQAICILNTMDSIQLCSNNLSGLHQPKSVKISNSVTHSAVQDWISPSQETLFNHLEDVCAPLYGACLPTMHKALL